MKSWSFLLIFLVHATGFASATGGDGRGFIAPDTQGTYYQRDQAPEFYQTDSTGQLVPTSNNSNQNNSENPSPDSLLSQLVDSNEKVRNAFDQCKEKVSSLSAVEACVWKAVKDDKQVISQMNELIPQEALPTNSDLNPISQTMDSATEKLTNYFTQDMAQEILGQNLSGNNNGNDDQERQNSFAKRHADHKILNDMFLSQASRGVMLAISNYCLEADPRDGFKLDPNEEERRKKNINSLSSPDSLSQQNNDWKLCAQAVSNICHGNPVTYLNSRGKKATTITSDTSSKTRACLVTNFIKQRRLDIRVAMDVREQFQKIRQDQQAQTIVASDKTWSAEKNKDQRSIDEMVIRSSDEIAEQSGIVEENERLLEEFKECSEKKDEEACKRYLSTDREAAQKMITEYRLRLEVAGKNLEELETDEQKLREYLKTQGYEDEKISELISISDEKGKKEIVKEITANYNAQKNALVADMAKQIEAATSAEQDKIDIEGKDKAKIQEIGKEIENRGQREKELVQFTNYVTSLLGVQSYTQNTGEDGEAETQQGVNLKPLEIELAGLEQAGSRGNSSDNNDKSRSKEQTQALIDSAQAIIKKNQANRLEQEGGSDLTLESLNQNFLRYFKTEEAQRKQQEQDNQGDEQTNE